MGAHCPPLTWTSEAVPSPTVTHSISEQATDTLLFPPTATHSPAELQETLCRKFELRGKAVESGDGTTFQPVLEYCSIKVDPSPSELACSPTATQLMRDTQLTPL